MLTTCLAFGQTELDRRWGFIKPCVTTKAEAEKIFSNPEFKINSSPERETYVLKGERITLTYSTEEKDKNLCKGNISLGTVTSFTVHGFDDLKLSELKIDLKEYKKQSSPLLRYIRIYSKDGILIVSEIDELQSKSATEKVLSIHFDPTNELYFVSSDGFLKDTVPFYEPTKSKKENFEILKAHFDNFYISWRAGIDSNDMKRQVIVYFDNKLPLREYRNLLNRLRNFVYSERKYILPTMPIIEGGMREKAEIEFFTWWGNKVKPPIPTPTVSKTSLLKRKSSKASQKRPFMQQ